VGADGRLRLQHDHFTPCGRERARNGEDDSTGADHRHVDA
jgi:hypothetical protein